MKFPHFLIIYSSQSIPWHIWQLPQLLVFLGRAPKSCYTRISHYSLQKCSSWEVTFKSFLTFLFGFRSGLWLGHSITSPMLLASHCIVDLPSCLWSLSCWNMNFWPILTCFADFFRFFLRISLYFTPFILPSYWTSSAIPANEKLAHNIMLPPSCITVGMVLFCWWTVLTFMPKSSTMVSSDHKTFYQFVAGSFRCLCMNFKHDYKWTFFFLQSLIQARCV